MSTWLCPGLPPDRWPFVWQSDTISDWTLRVAEVSFLACPASRCEGTSFRSLADWLWRSWGSGGDSGRIGTCFLIQDWPVPEVLNLFFVETAVKLGLRAIRFENLEQLRAALAAEAVST